MTYYLEVLLVYGWYPLQGSCALILQATQAYSTTEGPSIHEPIEYADIFKIS